jgi:hypothetical protein
MRNRADCLGMAEAAHKPPVEQLEDAALGLHRRLRGLIEESTHLAIAARDAVTAIDAGTLLVSWTGAHP